MLATLTMLEELAEELDVEAMDSGDDGGVMVWMVG